MEGEMSYNGTLTAEQFLFYEMRIVSKQFLEGKIGANEKLRGQIEVEYF